MVQAWASWAGGPPPLSCVSRTRARVRIPGPAPEVSSWKACAAGPLGVALRVVGGCRRSPVHLWEPLLGWRGQPCGVQVWRVGDREELAMRRPPGALNPRAGPPGPRAWGHPLGWLGKTQISRARLLARRSRMLHVAFSDFLLAFLDRFLLSLEIWSYLTLLVIIQRL